MLNSDSPRTNSNVDEIAPPTEGVRAGVVAIAAPIRCLARRAFQIALLAVVATSGAAIGQSPLVTLDGIAFRFQDVGDGEELIYSVEALSSDGQEVTGRYVLDASNAGIFRMHHDGRLFLTDGEIIPGGSQATLQAALSMEAVIGGAAWSYVRTMTTAGGTTEAILQGKRALISERDVVSIGLGGQAPATVLHMTDLGGCNATEGGCQLGLDTQGMGFVTEEVAVRIISDGQGRLVALERIAGTGDQLPGLPAPVFFISDVSLASNGNYGFIATDYIGNTGVYLNGVLVAATGMPSPIPGLSYGILNWLSVNAAGQVAFTGRLSDTRIVAIVDGAVVVDEFNPHPLIYANPAITCHQWEIINRPVLDDRGRLFVQAFAGVAPGQPNSAFILMDGVPFIIPNASVIDGMICRGLGSVERIWVDSSGTALQLGLGFDDEQGNPAGGWGFVLPPQSEDVCEGGLHSGSKRASISVHGPVNHASTKAILVGRDLPPHTAAVLLGGNSGATSVFLPAATGELCVNGPISFGSVVHSTADEGVRLNLTPDFFLPSGTAPAAGSTWTFQLWYRDPHSSAGVTSGLTSAVSVRFE